MEVWKISLTREEGQNLIKIKYKRPPFVKAKIPLASFFKNSNKKRIFTLPMLKILRRLFFLLLYCRLHVTTTQTRLYYF